MRPQATPKLRPSRHALNYSWGRTLTPNSSTFCNNIAIIYLYKCRKIRNSRELSPHPPLQPTIHVNVGCWRLQTISGNNNLV